MIEFNSGEKYRLRLMPNINDLINNIELLKINVNNQKN